MDHSNKTDYMLSYSILRLSPETYKTLALNSDVFCEDIYNRIKMLSEFFSAIESCERENLEKQMENFQSYNFYEKFERQVIIYISAFMKREGKIETFLYFINKYRIFSSIYYGNIDNLLMEEMKEEIISLVFIDRFNDRLPTLLSIYRYSRYLDGK